jgi:hypothetical protein
VTGSIEPRPAPTVTDVLYIGGSGRSGSTLLSLLLAQLPGCFAAGGVTNLWERGLKDNYLCGCGAHFRDCAFWQEVGQQAFGGWDAVDVDEIVRLKSEVTKHRNWPWLLLAPRARPTFSKKLVEYSAYMSRLYSGIKGASGCRIVIDPSHEVSPALLLRGMPNVRGRILHLVRDSRGVALSLSKRIRRAEDTTAFTYMAQYGSIHASWEWVVANLPYHVIPTRSLPRLRIHYEALVSSPGTEIARIAEFLGTELSPSELATFEADSLEIGENHMVSGHPHRLGETHVEIRLDNAWRERMSLTDRLLVTLLTLPLGLAYRYVGVPRTWTTKSRSSARGA